MEGHKPMKNVRNELGAGQYDLGLSVVSLDVAHKAAWVVINDVETSVRHVVWDRVASVVPGGILDSRVEG